MRMRPYSFAAAVVSLAVSAFATIAGATVTEPNGLVVPRDSMNGEVQLYTLFSMRSEALDFQTDAATTPAVFSPLCNFRATFVLHQAGLNLGVGWYNVDPAATTPPAASDIHVIVPPGSPVGTVVTSMNIRGDAAYRGGLVGFALVGSQTHYSEQRWNPSCASCPVPGPWATAVVYPSRVTPNSFYVAFEDGNVGAAPGSFNNDGDFNDDVFFFEGLSCDGGNQPCDTGMPGICGHGLTECSASGVTCHAVVTPRAESCNGLDDDCNGTIDDGSSLCSAGEVCDNGNCVPACVEGSCFAGETCTTRGTCVETPCATVTCPSEQTCVAGTCRGACDGVVCPGSQECHGGRCVDPCAGITCATGTACARGVCIPSCNCQPCGTGTACQDASGLCVDSGCETLTCGASQVCRAGACVDACAGATCPHGQMCSAGECVDIPPMPDAGTPDSGAPDASADARRDDAAETGDVLAVDASSDAMADGSRDAALDVSADGGGRVTTSSCGCAVPGRSRSGAPIGAIALAALVFASARRTRRAGHRRG